MQSTLSSKEKVNPASKDNGVNPETIVVDDNDVDAGVMDVDDNNDIVLVEQYLHPKHQKWTRAMLLYHVKNLSMQCITCFLVSPWCYLRNAKSMFSHVIARTN